MVRARPESAPFRLRMPASLAVTLVGASATVAMTIVGCESSPIPPPADAGQLDKRSDAELDTTDGNHQLADATLADGSPDARPDAPLDARPDAPPDARPPPDAYIPPDAPVG